jgi:hypothetical protein
VTPKWVASSRRASSGPNAGSGLASGSSIARYGRLA